MFIIVLIYFGLCFVIWVCFFCMFWGYDRLIAWVWSIVFVLILGWVGLIVELILCLFKVVLCIVLF